MTLSSWPKPSDLRNIKISGGEDLQVEATTRVQGEARRCRWIFPWLPSWSSLAILQLERSDPGLCEASPRKLWGQGIFNKVSQFLIVNLQVHKQSCLLLKDSPDLPEDLVEIKVGSIHCTNKPAIHFPVEMFPSALWVKICLMTEQEVTTISFSPAQ